MDKNTFANTLKNELNSRNLEGVTGIEIKEITKNNGQILTGLVIKDESNISPVLYIESEYSKYLNGTSIEAIADYIVDIYYHSITQKPDLSKNNIMDYESAKKNLFVMAVNNNRNAEMLENMPHMTIDDVSLIVSVVVDKSESSYSAAKITNELFKIYDVSLEQLFEDAWYSMKVNNPYQFKDIVDVMKEMQPDIPDFIFESMNAHRGELYVLSNDTNVNGAAYGFDKGVLKNICDDLCVDKIYILPSSIHELIIIPGNEYVDLENIDSMINSVNMSSVPENDVLGDRAYYYDAISNNLKLVHGDDISIEYVEETHDEDIDEGIDI